MRHEASDPDTQLRSIPTSGQVYHVPRPRTTNVLLDLTKVLFEIPGAVRLLRVNITSQPRGRIKMKKCPE
jgi:hypothetical protein